MICERANQRASRVGASDERAAGVAAADAHAAGAAGAQRAGAHERGRPHVATHYIRDHLQHHLPLIQQMLLCWVCNHQIHYI